MRKDLKYSVILTMKTLITIHLEFIKMLNVTILTQGSRNMTQIFYIYFKNLLINEQTYQQLLHKLCCILIRSKLFSLQKEKFPPKVLNKFWWRIQQL